MFDARRPVGRLFCLLMSVTAMLAVSQAQGPATTTINEGLFGTRSGAGRKMRRCRSCRPRFRRATRYASRQIVNEAQFLEAIRKID